MPPWYIILWVASGFGLLLGFAIALLGFVGDSARGRRRCPGTYWKPCWTPMGSAADLTCPKCGRKATDVKDLFRTRRSWAKVRGGTALLLTFFLLALVPVAHSGVWALIAPRPLIGYGLPWFNARSEGFARYTKQYVYSNEPGGPSRLPEWERAMVVQRAAVALDSPDADIRFIALQSIAALAKPSDNVGPRLDALEQTDTNPSVQTYIVVARISLIAAAGDDAVPELEALASSATDRTDAAKAWSAINALSRIDTPKAWAAVRRVASESTSTFGVTAAARTLFLRIGVDPEAMNTLLQLLDHPDGWVKRSAFRLVFEPGVPWDDRLRTAIGSGLRSSDASIRSEAVEAAIRREDLLGDREIRRILLDAAGDESAEVRKVAIDAGRSRDGFAHDLQVRYETDFGSSDTEVRRRGALALLGAARDPKVITPVIDFALTDLKDLELLTEAFKCLTEVPELAAQFRAKLDAAIETGDGTLIGMHARLIEYMPASETTKPAHGDPSTVAPVQMGSQAK
jgi:HEAT repeat protein